MSNSLLRYKQSAADVVYVIYINILVWSKKLCMEIKVEEIQKAFININKTIEVVRYRSFQYRLLHNIIFLNDRLVYFGGTNSNTCTQCNKVKETVMHLFYECTVTKQLLRQVMDYCENQYGVMVDISIKGIIFNSVVERPRHFLNLVILIVKYMVYSFKCRKKKITSNVIIQEIEFIHENECRKAMNEGKIKGYNSRWRK